jgi:transposase
VPALPSSVLEPLWVQVAALLPARQVHHPLGCHRRRIPDRLVFDKLVQVLVFGCGYRRIADHTHAWGNQDGKLRWCTERRRVVVEFWLALAAAAIVCGRLLRRAWSCYRWDGRPAVGRDHLLAQPLPSRAQTLAQKRSAGEGLQQVTVRLHVAVHVSGRGRHGHGRAGAGQSLPHAAVAQPDP